MKNLSIGQKIKVDFAFTGEIIVGIIIAKDSLGYKIDTGENEHWVLLETVLEVLEN